MDNYSGIDVLEIMDGAKNYNAYLTHLIARQSPSKKALDFGAGSGAFARALRAQGYDITCIEPDARLGRGLTNEGFQVFSSLAECREQFDYIYSVNVLEHIPDDRQTVESLQKALRPGGTLFLYVPAFMSLYSSFDKKIGHLRRYTKEELVATSQSLQVKKCHYVDSLGFVAAWFFKHLGAKDGTVSPLAVKVFDRVVFPLSRVLDWFVRPWFGKNVLLVAHKR